MPPRPSLPPDEAAVRNRFVAALTAARRSRRFLGRGQAHLLAAELAGMLDAPALRHAARHYERLVALAPAVAAWGEVASHREYGEWLQVRPGKKVSFWRRVEGGMHR